MDKSEHCKEVYAHFGLAVYKAQCVEQSIIQLLIFTDFFKRNAANYQSQEQWQKAFDKYHGCLSTKTLGQLISNLVSIGAIEASIGILLKEALSQRNWLAHMFFVDSALDFLSEEGRDLMINKLKDSCELFNAVENTLNPITQSLHQKYGLTQEVIESLQKELYIKANGDI